MQDAGVGGLGDRIEREKVEGRAGRGNAGLASSEARKLDDEGGRRSARVAGEAYGVPDLEDLRGFMRLAFIVDLFTKIMWSRLGEWRREGTEDVGPLSTRVHAMH